MASSNQTPAGYAVIVHFATSADERTVATYATFEAADRRAFEYTGADARGVWIRCPDGTRVTVA
jgi:hypothetical protein